MRPGTIIYRGKSKTGEPILIRYPNAKDTNILREFINTLSKERTYIFKQGDQLSYAAEKKYLKERLIRIKKNSTVALLAFSDGRLVGQSDISLHRGAARHEGVFGIAVAKGFRDRGIGTLLMKLVLREAKKNLKGIKIVSLGVFSNNPRAIALYKKIGFKKFGSLPKGVLHRGKYADHIFMYRQI